MRSRDKMGTRVAVLMTCFNRRTTTLSALTGLDGQRLDAGTRLLPVLLDDGSTDGTGEEVERRFPKVTLVRGSGELYWGGGMAQAQKVATETADPDYLLWLNDDVLLDPDAVASLLRHAREWGDSALVVGALRDPSTGATTYSGFRRHGGRPTQVSQVTPQARSQIVDTFNGNVVLVPRQVYRSLGGVDPAFRQYMGDIDYGYRAAKAGFPSVLANGHVGVCSRNSTVGTWQDAGVSRRARLRLLASPKGVPFETRARFLRRHSSTLWPVQLVGGYARLTLSIVLQRAT